MSDDSLEFCDCSAVDLKAFFRNGRKAVFCELTKPL